MSSNLIVPSARPFWIAEGVSKTCKKVMPSPFTADGSLTLTITVSPGLGWYGLPSLSYTLTSREKSTVSAIVMLGRMFPSVNSASAGVAVSVDSAGTSTAVMLVPSSKTVLTKGRSAIYASSSALLASPRRERAVDCISLVIVI